MHRLYVYPQLLCEDDSFDRDLPLIIRDLLIHEGEKIQLNRMYREAAEREKQNRIDQESWDDDREELKRLREQVFRMTQEDILISEVSLEEMEKTSGAGRSLALEDMITGQVFEGKIPVLVLY